MHKNKKNIQFKMVNIEYMHAHMLYKQLLYTPKWDISHLEYMQRTIKIIISEK